MKRVALILLIMLLMVPSITLAQTARQSPHKISFDFVDADVRTVLRSFAEALKKSMIIGEDVKGKVTIKLENVPFDEALDVILKNNELVKIDEDNVVRILTSKRMSTERERETKERLDFLKEKEAKQKLEEELVTETIYVNYADPSDVEKMIRGETTTAAVGSTAATTTAIITPGTTQRGRGLLSPNGVVTLVKWNSALIVKDTKESVDRIVRLIKEHDVPPQQVQIEARIVQASTNFSRDLGVQWSANYNNKIRGRDSGYMATVSPGMPAGAGTLNFFIGSVLDSFKLDVTLSALEADGKGKIISSPKIITSDNRPAKITQGQQIAYKNNTSSTSGATIEFKDATLELEVTPHVAKDGNVRLTVKAKKDRVDTTTLAATDNPPIEKREASTELLVRDGETAVIGGIYEITQEETDTGVPLLRQIPLLSWLFKRNTKTDNKTELLIFITPTIIKNYYTEKRDR